MRHAKTGRIFALVYAQDEHLYVDLKQNLADIEELVALSPAIIMGRHFDKQHWITVDVTTLSSKAELVRLVAVSYRLTDD